MRLWMIAPIKAYEVLKNRGRLTANDRKVDLRLPNPDAYSWMAEQMRERLAPPPCGVTYPLWAWARWDGTDRCKPDIRSCRYMEGPGKFVRIEMEVLASRVLLSDFEAWHAVLNGWYWSWSEAEYEEFHKRHEQHSEASCHAEVAESWNRIFDLEGGDPTWLGKPTDRSIQATLWYVRWEDVVGVTIFEGLANRQA